MKGRPAIGERGIDVRRRILVVLSWMLGAVGSVGACTTEDVDPSQSEDAGSGAGSLDRAECPPAQPTANSACRLPEGTTCGFDMCGTSVARCSQGLWRIGANPRPKPICPETVPAEGSSCPPCWPASQTCPFTAACTREDPDAAPGTANAALAKCNGIKWTVEFTPCGDAGPDVQGDADADAD